MTEPFSILMLLEFYSLELEDIARLCECSIHEVTAALDPARYTCIPLFTVLRIRAIIEKQLLELGWNSSMAELWHEFDD